MSRPLPPRRDAKYSSYSNNTIKESDGPRGSKLEAYKAGRDSNKIAVKITADASVMNDEVIAAIFEQASRIIHESSPEAKAAKRDKEFLEATQLAQKERLDQMETVMKENFSKLETAFNSQRKSDREEQTTVTPTPRKRSNAKKKPKLGSHEVVVDISDMDDDDDEEVDTGRARRKLPSPTKSTVTIGTQSGAQRRRRELLKHYDLEGTASAHDFHALAKMIGCEFVDKNPVESADSRRRSIEQLSYAFLYEPEKDVPTPSQLRKVKNKKKKE